MGGSEWNEERFSLENDYSLSPIWVIPRYWPLVGGRLNNILAVPSGRYQRSELIAKQGLNSTRTRVRLLTRDQSLKRSICLDDYIPLKQVGGGTSKD